MIKYFDSNYGSGYGRWNTVLITKHKTNMILDIQLIQYMLKCVLYSYKSIFNNLNAYKTIYKTTLKKIVSYCKWVRATCLLSSEIQWHQVPSWRVTVIIKHKDQQLVMWANKCGHQRRVFVPLGPLLNYIMLIGLFRLLL